MRNHLHRPIRLWSAKRHTFVDQVAVEEDLLDLLGHNVHSADYHEGVLASLQVEQALGLLESEVSGANLAQSSERLWRLAQEVGCRVPFAMNDEFVFPDSHGTTGYWPAYRPERIL